MRRPKSILMMHCCKLRPVLLKQAAPVKKDKPVAVDADGKKTAGRQVLKAKQWLEHQYRQEYTAEGLCPHCGQNHPRKLICDISDYLRVMQPNLRELLHEGRFSCPVVACAHCGTVYADRPAAMSCRIRMLRVVRPLPIW